MTILIMTLLHLCPKEYLMLMQKFQISYIYQYPSGDFFLIHIIFYIGCTIQVTFVL